MKRGYVYLLTNAAFGTLYIGVTSDLSRRIAEHENSLVAGFTKKHGLKTLVYFETYETITEAISREKQLKNWQRGWKIDLINEHNPEWKDLSGELMHIEA